MNTVYSRILLVSSITLVLGCDADAPTPPAIPDPEAYHAATSPDSVVANLILAHQRREAAPYAALLAPEFRFYFVPSDTARVGAEYWTRSQDSTGTAALFAVATRLEIAAAHSLPVLADETLFPPGTLRIHLYALDFWVERSDHANWRVDTDQELYFRKGIATAGEDPTHWLLLEWHEAEPTNAPLSGEDPTPVQGSTWGRMKSLFYLE